MNERIRFSNEITSRIFTFGLFLICGVYFISPVLPDKVLSTIDLSVHVRSVAEFQRALGSGQIPPIVAPDLNGGMRIPIFIHYSGTGYLVAALIGFLGFDEYWSLKLSILLLSAFGSWAMFVFLRANLGDRYSAVLGALSFQFFPTLITDLFGRGGYTEWVAAQYGALLLLSAQWLRDRPNSLSWFGTWLRTCVFVLATLLFVPCHPVQTVYSGLVIALITLALNCRPGVDKKGIYLVGIAGVLGILVTTWFWYPLLANKNSLKVIGHEVFLSADSTFSYVFSPFFKQSPTYVNTAPQLGAHVTLAILVLAFFWKKIERLYQVSLLITIFCLSLIVSPEFEEPLKGIPIVGGVYEAVIALFKPLQWTYRLFVLISLVQGLLVGRAAQFLFQRTSLKRKLDLLAFMAGVVIVGGAYPYLHLPTKSYQDSLSDLVSEKYRAPNAPAYCFYGTDFSSLPFLTADGKINTERPFYIPNEIPEFEVRLVLAPGIPDHLIPRVGVSNPERVKFALEKGLDGSSILIGRIKSEIGFRSQYLGIKFQSMGVQPVVQDLNFRSLGDSSEFRIPTRYSVKSRGDLFEPYKAEAHVSREGLYQLPFCYYPGQKVWINGQLAEQLSLDRHFYVTRLRAGSNEVLIQDRLPGWSGEVSILGFLGLIALILPIRKGRFVA